MTATRDNYQVQANNLQELVLGLNLLFQRMADRMDKIEGIRGTPEIFSNLDMNGFQITDLLQSSGTTDAVNKSELSDQTLSTTDSPTFQSLTLTANLSISGTLDVTGIATLIGLVQNETDSAYYKYIDSNDTVIHSIGTT
jgi:hypothetical protein